MEIINKILGLFYDRDKSLGHKLSYLIIFLFAIFIIEHYFDFTYNFYLNNKIEQLKTINDLKTIYSKDSIKLKNFKNIETKILEKKHYSEFLENIKLTDFYIFKTTEENLQSETKIEPIFKETVELTEKPVEKTKIRSRFWMVLSSTYFLVFINMIVIFIPFYDSELKKENSLIALIAVFIVVIMTISFITWIAYQIPVINNMPIWNYLLNALIHGFFLMIIFKKK